MQRNKISQVFSHSSPSIECNHGADKLAFVYKPVPVSKKKGGGGGVFVHKLQKKGGGGHFPPNYEKWTDLKEFDPKGREWGEGLR